MQTTAEQGKRKKNNAKWTEKENKYPEKLTMCSGAYFFLSMFGISLLSAFSTITFNV